MARIIAIAGLRQTPKAELLRALMNAIRLQGSSLTLIDNSETNLKLADAQAQRLGGGCVCCSLAGALIPLIHRVQTDYVLIAVAAAARPDAFARIIASAAGTRH